MNAVIETLPTAADSEQIVLGSLLVDPRCVFDVQEVLGMDGAAFSSELNREVYRAIVAVYAQHETAEPSAVILELRKRGNLGDIDFSAVLARCEMQVVAPDSTPIHCEEILRAYQRRQLIRFASFAKSSAEDAEADPEGLLAELSQRLLALSIGGRGDSEDICDQVNRALTVIERRANRLEEPAELTGLVDLDAIIGGFAPGDLVIIGGRPSMGKTALAATIALQQARRMKRQGEGYSVGFVSAEMGEFSVICRLLSMLCDLPTAQIKHGRLNRDELDAVTEAGEVLGDLPLHLTTRVRQASHLLAKVRAWAPRTQMRVLFVDYLQLLSHDLVRSRDASRTERVGETCSALKGLARDANVAVVALSQLSRASEKRGEDDRRPMLSDLRDSGQLEQDADMVLFPYRDAYSERDNPLAIQDAEIIVAKNRDGDTGTARCRFFAETMRFVNAAHESQEGSDVF